MSSDPIIRRQLIECGLANAQRFRWDLNATSVLEVYQHAVARGQVSRPATQRTSPLRSAHDGLSATPAAVAP